MQLADIATGETDTADLAYLVAAIVAFVAALLFMSPRTGTLAPLSSAMLAVAVGLVALGLLLL